MFRPERISANASVIWTQPITARYQLVEFECAGGVGCLGDDGPSGDAVGVFRASSVACGVNIRTAFPAEHAKAVPVCLDDLVEIEH